MHLFLLVFGIFIGKQSILPKKFGELLSIHSIKFESIECIIFIFVLRKKKKRKFISNHFFIMNANMFYPFVSQIQGANAKAAEHTTKRKRHIFTPEEDAKLKELVSQKGCLRWEEIAKEMDGLNPRQCRDRWTNFLDPKIVSKPWTKEEEQRLLQLVQIMGNCWVQISKRFKGRTDIQIKNKYNSLMQKMDLKSNKYPMNFSSNNFHFMNYPMYRQQPLYHSPPCSEPEPCETNSVDYVGSQSAFKDEESIFGLDFEEAFKLFA